MHKLAALTAFVVVLVLGYSITVLVLLLVLLLLHLLPLLLMLRQQQLRLRAICFFLWTTISALRLLIDVSSPCQVLTPGSLPSSRLAPGSRIFLLRVSGLWCLQLVPPCPLHFR